MTFHDDSYGERTDDWEERVARALEMQQKPKRPVWRLVAGVIVAMAAAYAVLSLAFNAGQSVGEGAGSQFADARRDASAADAARPAAPRSVRDGARQEGGLRSSASLNGLDERGDDPARLLQVRTGVSNGVRRAYREDEARTGIRRGVERALQSWEAGAAPLTPDTRAALDPRLPQTAVLSESPVRTVDAYTPTTPTAPTPGEPDPFQPLTTDGAAAAPATPPAPVEPAAPVTPVNDFQPQAPRGMWIAAPGASVPTEFTVTPEGVAINVTVPESAMGGPPLLLSAAVNAVSRARFPISPGGGSYRGAYTVRFPPSGEATTSGGGAVSRAAPSGAAPSSAAPAADPFADEDFFSRDPFAPASAPNASASGASAPSASTSASTSGAVSPGASAARTPASRAPASEQPEFGGFEDFDTAFGDGFDTPPPSRATSGAPSGAAPSGQAFGAPPPSTNAGARPAGVGRPVWLTEPTAYDVAAFYPPLAARAGIAGSVILSCTIGSVGELNCVVVSQNPTGMGFGDAALEVARGYTAGETLDTGAPALGARVTLPVRFDPLTSP